MFYDICIFSKISADYFACTAIITAHNFLFYAVSAFDEIDENLHHFYSPFWQIIYPGKYLWIIRLEYVIINTTERENGNRCLENSEEPRIKKWRYQLYRNQLRKISLLWKIKYNFASNYQSFFQYNIQLKLKNVFIHLLGP